MPGLLAGGPNPGQNDGQPYPSSMPGLSYTDNYLAYASNEIAINWNAPLTYLAIGIEDLLSPDGLPTGDIRQAERAVPDHLELLQNYPNPFNPETTVEYRLPQGGLTTVKIFDLLGRTVCTLQEGWQEAGPHRLTFDASRLPSGVYFCRLTALGSSQSIRMSLTK